MGRQGQPDSDPRNDMPTLVALKELGVDRIPEDGRRSTQQALKIHISAGVGSGTTKLAAFDAALMRAGVANCNLITLSSIILPGSELIIHDAPPAGTLGDWGDKLYVVLADTRVDTRGDDAWAGLGWVQDASGRGLFVEHVGNSQTRVKQLIHDSLGDLMRHRGMNPGRHRINHKIAGICCEQSPVCALAVAVFQARGWADVSNNQ